VRKCDNRVERSESWIKIAYLLREIAAILPVRGEDVDGTFLGRRNGVEERKP